MERLSSGSVGSTLSLSRPILMCNVDRMGQSGRHEHGLERIIRRRSLPRNIAIYNSPTQVRDRRIKLTKVLEKFKFAKFRFLILLQSSNFGLFPFLYGSKRSTKKICEQMNFKGHFHDMVSSNIIFLHFHAQIWPRYPKCIPYLTLF